MGSRLASGWLPARQTAREAARSCRLGAASAPAAGSRFWCWTGHLSA